jgi:hypothetical protein
VEEKRARRDLARTAYHDLVQEVLDELCLERSRRKKAMEIGTEELRDKVAVG